ncbi:MAG TPA: retropepsin-like aspartic protease, partial [Sphingobacteriaceae bacterium]
MRRIFLILIIFFQVLQSLAQVETYYSLYRKKSFPELQDRLYEVKSGDPAKRVFGASVYAAFGNYDQARALLSNLNEHQPLNDTLRFVRLSTELEIASRTKQYRKAADVAFSLLNNFRDWMPADGYEEEVQALKIHRIAQNVPAQSVRRTGDTRITMEKDRAGLMNIPVNIGDTTMNFVFDSGAGMSVISEKYAQKLNVKILSDSTVQIKSGSTGDVTISRVGLAASLRIGNCELKNVLFLVFPDSALSFAGGKYEIRGIIGFPVMAAMQEVTFAGPELFIPENPGRKEGGAPMILYNNMPVIYLDYSGAKLPFTFDTGANTSTLSNNFYD